ncbi:CamS family sex pheromone protein [Metabacillus sp. CT-WN-B3]|uniref:CamS family sex pheromone protein n=2 Tax=Metabacillus hrfriensis TaxID=3048891 RepID=A0ACD4RI20_9BACI|nr:CamS family sex pheromone protein [Metabacillus sp. CT-WN-B3]WHZ60127.1 CamS family sex pheromone protein [Metabacillus sp. CT-WN-B3]
MVMLLAGCLFLSACAPSFGDQEEIVRETEDESTEKAIIPKYNISDSYYKMILPFKEGKARGLVAENINTRLDIDEFETGLMRVAQDEFSPDNHLYQEGQYLDEKTVREWLGRKLEGDKLKEAQEKAKANDETFKNEGLNPIASTEGDYIQQNENSPIYLAHMLEHNYLVRKGENTVELGGVVIGLALNSVHYYREAVGEPQREYVIDPQMLEAEGKKMAEEVIKRVRSQKGLENVPVVIALYKQAPKSSIVPGSFIASTVVDGGSNQIGKWDSIDEEYVFFPSPQGTEDYREDANLFERFKQDIDEFFPNYTGVIGKAFYKGEEMQELKIDIPMQFYGKSEVIAFTQFVTGKVVDYFPDYVSVEVNINSTSGQEALIVRKPGQEKPTVHIYQ